MEIHIDRGRCACKDMGITEKGGGPAKWKVAIDRERWPTVEVEPLKVADLAQWRDHVPVDRLPLALVESLRYLQG
jgi:hypothetical protein